MTPNCTQLHNDWLETTRFLLMIAIVFGQGILLKVTTKFLMTKHCLHLTLDLFPQMDKRHPITKHLELKTSPLILP